MTCAGDAGDDRRLARIGVLVGGGEPVPIATVVSRPGLVWIDDQKGVALGEFVHASAGCEVRTPSACRRGA